MTCKNCGKRYPACQDYCLQFAAEKESQRDRKEKIRAAREAEMLANGVQINLMFERRKKYAK